MKMSTDLFYGSFIQAILWNLLQPTGPTFAVDFESNKWNVWNVNNCIISTSSLLFARYNLAWTGLQSFKNELPKKMKWIFLFQSLLSFPHPALHPRGCALPVRGFSSLRNQHRGSAGLLFLAHSLFFFCLFSATRALLNWMDFILHVEGARFLSQKNTDGGFIHMNVSFTSRYETGAEIVWF